MLKIRYDKRYVIRGNIYYIIGFLDNTYIFVNITNEIKRIYKENAELITIRGSITNTEYKWLLKSIYIIKERANHTIEYRKLIDTVFDKYNILYKIRTLNER